MDGNRRWALQRGLPIVEGYRKGIQALKKTVKHSIALNINSLTIFAFSAENAGRPKSEILTLSSLLEWYLMTEITELNLQNIKFRTLGDLSFYSKRIQNLLISAEKLTEFNNKMILNLAINYGGRQDIIHAVKNITKKVINNKINIDQIDQHVINSNLMSKNISDIDLLIRTGGEKRLSNFLLWQTSYSELYLCKVPWPDFNETELEYALKEYNNRNRRFGKASTAQ